MVCLLSLSFQGGHFAIRQTGDIMTREGGEGGNVVLWQQFLASSGLSKP